jgi:TPR repeat protein
MACGCRGGSSRFSAAGLGAALQALMTRQATTEMFRLCSMLCSGYYGGMGVLRAALACVLLLAGGCDTAGPVPAAAPAAEPELSAQPAPVAAVNVPEVAEPPAAEPAGDVECATSEACSAAASIEERAKHFDKAAALYERTCGLGLPQACHRAGELYRDGKGVAADDARARALFERGCREGSSSACDALGH